MENSEKVKNIKLINQLNKDTNNNTLIWENTHKDSEVTIFKSSFIITPLKKLVFYLKFSETSDVIHKNNILNVVLKNENTNKIIKNITLYEYPSLVSLIKIVRKMYLGKDFVSPYYEPKKTKTVSDDDLNEYKEIIKGEIKSLIKKMPTSTSAQLAQANIVLQCYTGCKEARSKEELNNLLDIAKKAADKHNPIGTPRWAR